MQISMPPARPPAGIRDLDPETPRLPAAQPAAARDPPPSWTLPTHAPPPPCPGKAWRGDKQGKVPLARTAPPARPGSGAGPWRSWPARKRGWGCGAGGQGSKSPRGPPARMAFPGCVSLAFPDSGAAAARVRGPVMAGRREAGGGAAGMGRGSEPPALGAVRGGGGGSRLNPGAGRSRQLPGSAPRGPSRTPPPPRPAPCQPGN